MDGPAGIDAGASLWKVALIDRELDLRLVPAGAVDEVERLIADRHPSAIGVTGCGAARIAASIETAVRIVPEFDAWAGGAPILAARAALSLPDRYLLISLGTGTSVLEIDRAAMRRAGGVALGGGTVLGLARLLCGTETFSEVAALAAAGDRTGVDLLVGDLYPEGGLLRTDMTASSFGKLASRNAADLAHALMWLVGENIGLVCAGIAQARAIDTLVFGGTTLASSSVLMESLRNALAGHELKMCFLPDGAFCGAVGAAAMT